MSGAQHHQPGDSRQAESARDLLLGRMEQSLTRQLALAKDEDLEAASRAAGEIDALLAEANRSLRRLSAEQARRLAGVLKLHRQIGLVLAQKRDEVSRKLQHGGQGKKLLKAYRQGPA